MADKYISVEAASAYAPLPKHLREYQTSNLDDAWEDGYDFAIRQIQALPAADVVTWEQLKKAWQIATADVVERKRGEWIDAGDFISCSVCGSTRMKEFESYYGRAIHASIRTNYCPNCGASMRGESDG